MAPSPTAASGTRAAQTLKLLEWNGGGTFGSGIGIGNLDAQGNVHPDQFWQTHTLGNVRQRPFSEIWSDLSDPLMNQLKEKKLLIEKMNMQDMRQIIYQYRMTPLPETRMADS